jgi:DNA-binding PadR family transcriptional regulator
MNMPTGKLGKMQALAVAHIGDGCTISELSDRIDAAGCGRKWMKESLLQTLRRLEVRGLVKAVLRPVGHNRGGYPNVLVFVPCDGKLGPCVTNPRGSTVKKLRLSEDNEDILRYLSEMGESTTLMVAHAVYCDGSLELINDTDIVGDATSWAYNHLSTLERYGLVECTYRKRGYHSIWIIADKGRDALAKKENRDATHA